LWLAPALALLPALVPFAHLIGRVLGSGSRIGEVVLSGETGRLVANTGLLVILVITSTAIIGIGAAWLTEVTDLPARPIWRVVVALPLVMPSYVIALALLAATGPRGYLSDLTGLNIPSLTGLPGAWLTLTIASYPYVYLAAGAALRRLDPAHEEAARGLGAGPARTFRTILLPQLRPAVGAGLLVVALYTLSDFGAVSLVRFDSFSRVVYAQYAGRLDRTPAAVLAVLLVLLALVVVWAEWRTRGHAAYHGRPVQRTPRLAALGTRGRVIGTATLGALATVSLAFPIGVLLAWAGRATGAARDIPWQGVQGSLTAAVLAAAVAAVLALPTAVLLTRHSSAATRWVERTAYAVFALPHVTVGLAMVFFAARYLGGLYQSLAVLIAVYAAVFFAQALGPVRAAVLQVSPSIEEASRSLGAGPVRTMLRVTAPMVRRGLFTGALLVFLTTMKELPVTLLLRPTGFETLAVDVWSAADSLLYSRAAIPAILLLLVAALPTYLLTRRER
jgi:iron(III) transport system permease protein